jgi:hypothetical protein
MFIPSVVHILTINESIDCLRYDLHHHDEDNDMQKNEKKTLNCDETKS